MTRPKGKFRGSTPARTNRRIRGAAPTPALPNCKFRGATLAACCVLLFAFVGLQARPGGDTPEDDTPGGDMPKGKSPGGTSPAITVVGRRVNVQEEAAAGSVITGKEIAERSHKTLDDVIQFVPGMAAFTHSRGFTRLRIRGLEQDKLAIILDGILLDDVFTTDVDISQIPVSGISDVIVTRGSTSALLGTRGSLGSVEILTRKPRETELNVSSEYGEFKNHFLGFHLGLAGGNFHFLLAGSLIDSSGYRPSRKLDPYERRKQFDRFLRYELYGQEEADLKFPAKKDYLDDTGKLDHVNSQKRNVFARAGYELSPNIEFGALFRGNRYQGMSNHFQLNSYSDYKPENLWWQDPTFEVRRDNDVKKAALRNRSFVWPEVFSLTAAPYLDLKYDTFKMKTAVFRTFSSAEQIGYASNDHAYAKDSAAVISPQALHYDPFRDVQTSSVTGIQVLPSFEFVHWNRLSFAARWRRESYREDEGAVSYFESPNIVEKRLSASLYPIRFLQADYFTLAVEDETYLLGLRFFFGVSYDSQNLNVFKFRENAYIYRDSYVPRQDTKIMGTREAFSSAGGLVWDAVEDFLKLRAAGSIKSRFPGLGDYEKVVDERRDRLLRSEITRNLNAGAEFSFFKESLRARADCFLTRDKDRIAKIAAGDEPPVNVEKVTSRGLELGLFFNRKRFAGLEELELSALYTFTRARVRDRAPEEKVNKGEFLELTPVHQFIASIRIVSSSGTSVNVWGNAEQDQIMYAMKFRPSAEERTVFFSTDYFEPVRLHNPVFLNVKLGREFGKRFTLYVMCKNVLDDRAADPFNPGPGRMFFFGGSAKF